MQNRNLMQGSIMSGQIGMGAGGGGGGGSVTPQNIQQQSFIYTGTDTGTADHYVIDLDPAITSYMDGMKFCFLPANNNTTGSPDININGLGTISIIGVDSITPGDISANYPCIIQCVFGAFFYLLNPRNVAHPGQIQHSSFIWARAGFGPSYTANLFPAITSYGGVPPVMILFRPANDSSGGDTLALNGLSALPIVKNDSLETPISAGDLKAGCLYLLAVDASGSNWLVLNL